MTLLGAGSVVGRAVPWALLLVLLLCAATAFLYRSMTKQLRKVPKTFDRRPAAEVDEPTDKRG